MRLHFLSGLPRSGSTMLAALLAQNPRIRAGMTTPLASMFAAIEQACARRNETAVFVTPEQRSRILIGLFDSFYGPSDIVIDTSRMWCSRLPLLSRLFPEARMIVCVREIGWILDSFERLYRRNGQTPSGIHGWDSSGTVFSRTSALASPDGVVGYAINAVREAVAAEEADRLLLVDYEELCKEPRKVLSEIYDFISLGKIFSHDVENVTFEAGEFDRQLGAEGLHTVSGRIEWRPRKTVLPPELFNQFNGPNFWR